MVANTALLFVLHSIRFEHPVVYQFLNMQIFVGSTSYEVDSAASVESLKVMIENKEFIPLDQIRLMRGNQILEGGSLAGNGVEDEDELTLSLEVNAGMRRKWRKKRMRRLRRKVRAREHCTCILWISTFPITFPHYVPPLTLIVRFSHISAARCVSAPVKQ